MRPAFLHLDAAILGQRALVDRAGQYARMVDARGLGPALRLWSRPAALDQLRELIAALDYDPANPDIFFLGSGDFHHVSALLIARVCEALDEPITILHFDNHPDWVKFENGLHCGSWAARVARFANVRSVITVGVCSNDVRNPAFKGADLSVVSEGRLELYAYRGAAHYKGLKLAGKVWPTIEAMGERIFTDFLATRIQTRKIYITIDKDVLRPEDACTNWDQGRVGLDFLLRMLTKITERARIAGADIVGDWSMPHYQQGDLNSLLKIAENVLDQPRSRVTAEAACEVNERTNIRLLEFFTESAA